MTCKPRRSVSEELRQTSREEEIIDKLPKFLPGQRSRQLSIPHRSQGVNILVTAPYFFNLAKKTIKQIVSQ